MLANDEFSAIGVYFTINGQSLPSVAARLQKKQKRNRSTVPLFTGGDKGSRTPDLLNAIETLYQLSYIPVR